MKKIIPLIILTALTSCGTIFGGTKKTVYLSPSDTSGKAEVTVDNINLTLPAIVEVSRGNKVLAITVKENNCYKSSKTIVNSKFNMFSLLNILGGLFGLSSTTTDGVTGGLWTYDNSVVVNLSKKPGCEK